MSCHDCSDAIIYKPLERHKFRLPQSFLGRQYPRKAEVRINVCISMPGEVFRRWRNILRGETS